ncbi:MAG: hypothetical protein RLZZ584_2870 [Pseudomonadota bacterium]
MHPLLNTLLDATTHWLDGLCTTLARSGGGRMARPGPAGRGWQPALADVSGACIDSRMRSYVPPLAPERNRTSLARARILEARARLNPAHRRARMRSAPDDACRTVISGRMVEVCALLDLLVAREATRP